MNPTVKTDNSPNVFHNWLEIKFRNCEVRDVFQHHQRWHQSRQSPGEDHGPLRVVQEELRRGRGPTH